jgi:RecA-family ATPase
MILEHEPRKPAPPEQEPPPEVKLIRGDSIKPEAIDWLWDGWLARGKLHVLAGAPGTGKSTIAFALAAAITAGRKWPDGIKAPRGNVLIWSGEDDPADTIMPRLLAAGADPRNVFIVSGTEHKGEHRPFDPAKDMDALRHQAVLVGDVHLLIADPIVSAVAGDSHKNTEVRRALQPLVDLGAMLGCAVLGISHFSKGTAGRDPTERVTGNIRTSRTRSSRGSRH